MTAVLHEQKLQNKRGLEPFRANSGEWWSSFAQNGQGLRLTTLSFRSPKGTTWVEDPAVLWSQLGLGFLALMEMSEDDMICGIYYL